MSRLVANFVAIVLLQAVVNILTGPVSTRQSVLGKEQCTDFYTYVCGKGASTIEPVKFVTESRENAKAVFENYPLKTKFLTAAEKKYYYDWKTHCMAPSMTDNRKDFIRKFNFPDSIGGWPAFNNSWAEDKFKFENAIADLASYDVPVIFSIKIKPDYKTFASKISIDAIETTQLLTEPKRMSIKNNLSPIIENIEDVINDSIIVENWYETVLYSDYKDSLNTDFKGLQIVLPEINWDKQVKAVFNHQVPHDFPVEVKRYTILKEVLSRAFKTNPKVLANYMLYRFAANLPDLDDKTEKHVFKFIIFQLLVKGLYNLEDVDNMQEMKSLLYALLKRLYKAEMLFNREKEDEVERRILSFVKDTIPDIDDAYYDNAYSTFDVNPNDCLSNVMELLKIRIKLENEKVWNYGPLDMMQPSIIDMLVNQLPEILSAPFAYKYRILTWAPLRDFIRFAGKDVYSRKTLYDCEISQREHEFIPAEKIDYYGIPLIVQGYSDWVKTWGDLFIETSKFSKDSKANLMEFVMRYYCDKNIDRSFSKKISSYFANLKEFQYAFNCPKIKC